MAYCFCSDCVLEEICADYGMTGFCKAYISKTRGPEKCVDCENLDRESNHCTLTDELMAIYVCKCENFKRRKE